MANLDMKKTLKHLYAPSAKEISIIDVSPMSYLMIDGTGSPKTETYQQSVAALYGLAYGIRAIRKSAGETLTVMPLEGLWSFQGEQDRNFSLTEADKEDFIWTLMILQPESITPEIVAEARENVQKKKPDLSLLQDVRFENYHEGESVQIMHIGSYDEEGPTVFRLHQHIEQNGWSLGKKHHEIYLSDPRKVAPEKRKTIIRQPFVRNGH